MTKFSPARLFGFTAACLAAALLAAPSSEAYPTARVETQTRPDFGLLLRPAPKRRKPYRPHRYTGDRGYPDRPHGDRPWDGDRPGDGPGRDVAFVDCAEARGPNAINRALASLKPGGTLIIRSRGEPCLDQVRVTKAVTIQGEDRYWRDGIEERGGRQRGERGRPRTVQWSGLVPTIRARGGVCMDIVTTDKVVLRDIILESVEDGDAPCLVSQGANLVLESTLIHYKGSGPAVYVDGGTFGTRDNTLIEAETYDRAVYIENGEADIDDLTITGSPSIGVEIEPTSNADSRIENVRFWSRANIAASEPASVGIVVSPSRTSGKVHIRRAQICGFAVGLWSSSARLVTIKNSHICRAVKGISVHGGELEVEDSYIGAQSIGIQIGAAKVTLGQVNFYGVRYRDIYLEPGAQPPFGADSRFFSGSMVDNDPQTVDYAGPCQVVPLDERHGDWRRYRGRSRRDGPSYYVPGWRMAHGECQDPGSLDGWVMGAESQLGYDQEDDFYARQAWPSKMYHNENQRWGPDGRPRTGQ